MIKKLRCGIYTRKSSEEGLEQGFNSLHAQREACEAYILSQAGECWSLVKTHYDDGGFSGGSMDRPGLAELLADIGRGKIDVVVVYKVDRLTRSLADFARIVDAFDQQGVSFVSVTQAFNTTTSMGRLTLNVLLSFAQFEREVTGERIRDKIAASKKKGMWMGGHPPLGYRPPTDPLTRTLALVPEEADTVRLIFQRYLEIGSVHELKRWLDEAGIRSKAWTSTRGRKMGGQSIQRGALFHLLKNRVYLGEVTHRQESYPADHPPIIDRDTFDAVQTSLTTQSHRHRTRTTRVSTMMLKGLVYDADGARMSPTFGHGKSGQIYRYYVSSPLQKGQRPDPTDGIIRRAQADALEARVTSCLERLSGSSKFDVATIVARVEVHPTTIQLLVRRAALFRRASDPNTEYQTLAARLGPDEPMAHEAGDEHLIRITIACRLKRSSGRVWISEGRGPSGSGKPQPDRFLIRALRSAHELLKGDSAIPLGQPENFPLESAPKGPYFGKLCRLAFLAPDIQAAILEGRQPFDLTQSRLLDAEMPILWNDQRRLFGFPC